MQLLQAMHAAGHPPRTELISFLRDALAAAEQEQQRAVQAAIEAATSTTAAAVSA
jgi:hypothetical protein